MVKSIDTLPRKSKYRTGAFQRREPLYSEDEEYDILMRRFDEELEMQPQGYSLPKLRAMFNFRASAAGIRTHKWTKEESDDNGNSDDTDGTPR